MATTVAKKDINSLVGTWSGNITKNESESKKTTAGDSNTPVSISFTSVANKQYLEGSSVVGTSSPEAWRLANNYYTWEDDALKVTSTPIAYSNIPSWIRDEAGPKKWRCVFRIPIQRLLFKEKRSGDE